MELGISYIQSRYFLLFKSKRAPTEKDINPKVFKQLWKMNWPCDFCTSLLRLTYWTLVYPYGLHKLTPSGEKILRQRRCFWNANRAPPAGTGRPHSEKHALNRTLTSKLAQQVLPHWERTSHHERLLFSISTNGLPDKTQLHGMREEARILLCFKAFPITGQQLYRFVAVSKEPRWKGLHIFSISLISHTQTCSFP